MIKKWQATKNFQYNQQLTRSEESGNRPLFRRRTATKDETAG